MLTLKPVALLVSLVLLAATLTACSDSSSTTTTATPTTSKTPPPTKPAKAKPSAPDAPSEPPVSISVAATRLNVNTASHSALEGLGIGHQIVHEFEEYRPYVSIQQFRKKMAKYVDRAQIDEYEKLIFVPIAPDTCDAETLQQLPGIDSRVATKLIAARPYGSNEAFLERLDTYLDDLELDIAASYLVEP